MKLLGASRCYVLHHFVVLLFVVAERWLSVGSRLFCLGNMEDRLNCDQWSLILSEIRVCINTGRRKCGT